MPKRLDPCVSLIFLGVAAVLAATTACGQSPPSSTAAPPTATETPPGPQGPATASQEPASSAEEPSGAPGAPPDLPGSPLNPPDDPSRPAARPDRTLTPGAVRTTDRGVICGHSTREFRHTTRATKRDVLRAYGVLGTPGYVADHLVPLEAGGEDTAANLWAEPIDQSRAKDRCENRAHKLICQGKLTPEDAQRGFVEDFGAFCRSLGNPVR